MIFYLSKTSIPKNNRIWVTWVLKKRTFHWCRWKFLFTEGRHILKTSTVDTIFEKVSLLNCDLWSLRNQHSRKQQNLSYLSPKEKSFHWCCWKNLSTLGRLITKTSTAEINFEEVSLLYFDLWFLQNRHSRKQQNQELSEP